MSPRDIHPCPRCGRSLRRTAPRCPACGAVLRLVRFTLRGEPIEVLVPFDSEADAEGFNDQTPVEVIDTDGDGEE